MYLLIVTSLALFFSSCSGLEKSEKKKIKEKNYLSETIHRSHNEYTFSIEPPTLANKPLYPWDSKMIGDQVPITKEFFRCKGIDSFQPILIKGPSGSSTFIQDCDGIDSHSLPIKEGKEHIYPILIELLNLIQEKVNQKVVITCGHQCPTHQLFSNPDHKPSSSKHQIGAEVDFYVEGMEANPEEVLKILENYYMKKEHIEMFGKLVSSVGGFSNKEIAVKIVNSNEGRDLDNNHPYPYLSLQVKWDRFTKTAVSYSWYEAHNNTYKY